MNPSLAAVSSSYSSLPWVDLLHETFEGFESSRQCSGERPLRFRTTFSPFKKKLSLECPLPTRDGLDTLWISGSAQMKKEEMEALREKIPSHIPIYFVDLRREKHAYWEGNPVKLVHLKKEREKGSWKWRSDLNKEITGRLQANAIDSVLKEKAFANQCGLIPMHIKAKEKDISNQRDIDQFVAFFDTLKGERWVHFHCAAGWNRTTTYMIAADMLLNSKISKEEILLRHRCLGGDDYLNKSSGKVNRLFLDQFYLFAQEKVAGSTKTWSEYCLGGHLIALDCT